jgi:ATP-dependent DNA helicase PIF1
LETPKNIDPDAGIVNGTRGIVTGFVSQQVQGLNTTVLLPEVRFSDKLTPWVVELTTWATRRTPTATERDMLQSLREDEHPERVRIMENLVIARRKQIPIRLAWALSIHKCQGMTLDAIDLSTRHIFEYGQAYVAFSRARRLSSVYLRDFFPSKVRAHPDVCEFYERIANANPIAQEEGNTVRKQSYQHADATSI